MPPRTRCVECGLRRPPLNNGVCRPCIDASQCAHCNTPIEAGQEVMVCKECHSIYHSDIDLMDIPTSCNTLSDGCCGMCQDCGGKKARFPANHPRYCRQCWEDKECPICHDLCRHRAPEEVEGLDDNEDINVAELDMRLIVLCGRCNDPIHDACAKRWRDDGPCCG